MAINLGSIANDVLQQYEVSSTVSGNLIAIADRARLSVENWTKLTLGSVSIDSKYEPVLVCATALFAFTGDQTVGADKSIRLGEFSVTPSTNNSVMGALRDDLKRELASLGRSINFKQTFT